MSENYMNIKENLGKVQTIFANFNKDLQNV